MIEPGYRRGAQPSVLGRRVWLAFVVVWSLLMLLLTGLSIHGPATPGARGSGASRNGGGGGCTPQMNFERSRLWKTGKYVAPTAKGALAFKGFNVLNGDGSESFGDVAVRSGVIASVTQRAATPNTGVQLWLTPGLVDMHSHVGVDGFPASHGTGDTNEMTNPTTPQVRAVDAFDIRDPAISLIAQGGVTTSQVLPGSGNTMGGEGLRIKMRRMTPSRTVADMLVPGDTVVKWACGENPKRVYGSRKQMPMSRMGNAWVMRQKLEAAQRLMAQQDACESGSGASDLALEALVDVLRRKATLNVHCYQVHDQDMIMRLADEFNFTINAFHHAHESYLIADVLAERNITVATFADLFAYKMEARRGSVFAPAKLAAAGVSVALKSDHPVLFAKELLLQAQKAYHWGLSKAAAFAAVTSVPAAAIGLPGRAGTLATGAFGDVVVWDRHPLQVGARALAVYIDGVLEHDGSGGRAPSSGDVQPSVFAAPAAPAPVVPTKSVLNVCSDRNRTTTELSGSAFSVQADALWTGGPQATLLRNAVVNVDAQMRVTCVGTTCARTGRQVRATLVIPGMVSVLNDLTNKAIQAEADQRDGEASGSPADLTAVRALDGAKSNTLTTYSAYASGVLSAVVAPLGEFVLGQGAAVRLTPGLFGAAQLALTNASTGLHVQVGVNGRPSSSSLASSTSGQLAALRELLAGGENASAIVQRVLNGSVPLVVHTDQADDVINVALAARELGVPRLVLVGAQEAHLVADQLASLRSEFQYVGAVLQPWRCMPSAFRRVRCSDAAFTKLSAAGVAVSISLEDFAQVRSLRWEAGWLRNDASWEDVMRAVTSNAGDAFGVEGLGRIVEGQAARFVAYDGDPTQFGVKPELIVDNGVVTCHPEQN